MTDKGGEAVKDRIEITTLEQLRILAHPMRWRVIQLFSGGGSPLSVKQMADRLGEPHSKVHYHVRRLVKGGFLEEVGEQLVNGIVERFYQVTAKSIEGGPEIKELPGVEGLTRLVRESLFESVQEVYQEAVRENRELHVQFQEGYLTHEQVERLTDLITQEMEAHATPRPGARRVRWVTMASMAREEEKA